MATAQPADQGRRSLDQAETQAFDHCSANSTASLPTRSGNVPSPHVPGVGTEKMTTADTSRVETAARRTEFKISSPLGQVISSLVMQLVALAVAIAFGIFAVQSLHVAVSANGFASQAISMAQTANQLSMLAICAAGVNQSDSDLGAVCSRLMQAVSSSLLELAEEIYPELASQTSNPTVTPGPTSTSSTTPATGAPPTSTASSGSSGSSNSSNSSGSPGSSTSSKAGIIAGVTVGVVVLSITLISYCLSRCAMRRKRTATYDLNIVTHAPASNAPIEPHTASRPSRVKSDTSSVHTTSVEREPQNLFRRWFVDSRMVSEDR